MRNPRIIDRAYSATLLVTEPHDLNLFSYHPEGFTTLLISGWSVAIVTTRGNLIRVPNISTALMDIRLVVPPGHIREIQGPRL